MRPGAHEFRAGAAAGATAGLTMSMLMMAIAAARGESVWALPNVIAATWMGPGVAGGELSPATVVGFATHMATSTLMGVVAVPFIYALPRWRTMLAALSYALASYPLVFASVMTWANPLMVRRAGLVPMAIGHAWFGLMLGGTYWALHGRRAPGSSSLAPRPVAHSLGARRGT